MDHARHLSILQDYWQTLTDPGHVLTELTFIFGEALVGAILGRIWLRRHDRRQHNVRQSRPVTVDTFHTEDDLYVTVDTDVSTL